MVVGVVTEDRLPLPVDEKLLEVPADVAVLVRGVVDAWTFRVEDVIYWRAVGLEIGVQWMLVLPVHIHFLCQVEGRNKAIPGTDVLERVEDFRTVPAWLLLAKLVTGDAQDMEAIQVSL